MMSLPRRILTPQERPLLTRILIADACYGVAEALAVLGLVPAAAALAGRDGRSLLGAVAWIAAWTVAAALAHWAGRTAAFTLAMGAISSMHRRLGDHLASLPLGWFRTDRAGPLAQLSTQGVFSVCTAYAHLLTPVIAGLSGTLTLALAALVLDVRLGVALLLGGLFAAACTRGGLPLATRADAAEHDAKIEVDNRVIEFAQSQQVLRAFGQATSYTPLEAGFALERRRRWRAFTFRVLGNVLNAIGAQTVVTVALVLVAYLAIGGSVDPLRAMALMAVAARFFQPLEEIGQFLVGLRPALANMRRFDEFVSTPVLPAPTTPSAITDPGLVELEGVGFSYGATPVLRDITLTAPPRTMTALIGPSGSGKTTITRLIARFWDVDSGTVRVGGADVRDLSTVDLMGQLSFVFQDVYLYDDTLEANVRVGREGATREDVYRVAALAGVDEIVQRLPDGWRTRVGEGGAALSGGERQRVSIARALLKQAPIVLLDEATSALDPENEHHIREVMERLRATSTLVVIAHRLDTVRAADQIVVLGPDGQIEQRGRHEELVALPGRYRDFWEERAAVAGWRLAGRT